MHAYTALCYAQASQLSAVTAYWAHVDGGLYLLGQLACCSGHSFAACVVSECSTPPVAAAALVAGLYPLALWIMFPHVPACAAGGK